MKIEGLAHHLQALQPISQPKVAEAKTSEGLSFEQMFSKAIKEVDSMQKDANSKIESLVLGDKTTTPHAAMIALEKAEIAFTLMTQVQSKIMRAYEEVMRTQV